MAYTKSYAIFLFKLVEGVFKIKYSKEKLKLNKDEKDVAIEFLLNYIYENYELEMGRLQADILADEIADNFGIFYYNKGVYDSMRLMHERIDDLYLLIDEEKLT